VPLPFRYHMKVHIHIQCFVKKADFLPAEFVEDFDEHLSELARSRDDGRGNVVDLKELSDLISSLIEEKADRRYIDALRELLGVCRDNSVNEVIIDE